MSGNTSDYGNDPADYTTAGGGSVQSLIDAASGVNSGWSFNQPKSADTVPSNATQSMQPVTASASASDSGFSDFWRGVAPAIFNTGTAIVAQKYGVTQPASTMPVAPAPAQNQSRTLLMIAAFVGVVLLVAHKEA